MGLLTFALNVTLDGCIDHREGIADDEMLDYFTRLMNGAGAMLFGRATYELMEDAWPAVARDETARAASPLHERGSRRAARGARAHRASPVAPRAAACSGITRTPACRATSPSASPPWRSLPPPA